MNDKKFLVPDYITGDNLRQIRKELKMTQKDFALLMGCGESTIRRWEKDGEKVTGPIVLLAKLLKEYPETVDALRIPEKVYPLRLFYMYEQDICTVIDVNERTRQIQIWNFTKNIMFRAFGNNEHPDYEQYQKFLESRCFPRTRDKMKLILKDLDIPFYDPYLIIQKTEGRMAEDHFWIKIEKE